MQIMEVMLRYQRELDAIGINNKILRTQSMLTVYIDNIYNHFKFYFQFKKHSQFTVNNLTSKIISNFNAGIQKIMNQFNKFVIISKNF